jgi:hypothetical protein
MLMGLTAAYQISHSNVYRARMDVVLNERWNFIPSIIINSRQGFDVDREWINRRFHYHLGVGGRCYDASHNVYFLVKRHWQYDAVEDVSRV